MWRERSSPFRVCRGSPVNPSKVIWLARSRTSFASAFPETKIKPSPASKRILRISNWGYNRLVVAMIFSIPPLLAKGSPLLAGDAEGVGGYRTPSPHCSTRYHIPVRAIRRTNHRLHTPSHRCVFPQNRRSEKRFSRVGRTG